MCACRFVVRDRVAGTAIRRGTVSVAPPPGCVPTVIAKRPMPVLPDPAASVARALVEPVGVPALHTLARGKRSACILICDITRPVPNGLVLPHVLKTIAAAGIPPERIEIVVATGLHRANTPEELAVMTSPELVAKYRFRNHVARNADEHVYLGRTATRMQERLYAERHEAYHPELLIQPESVGDLVSCIISMPEDVEVTDVRMRPSVKSY